MERKVITQRWIVLGIALFLFTAAGFPQALQAQTGSPQGVLKIALLPILDAFPYYVAEANGFFDRPGLKVKAVPVASGLERDQLMQSGAIDGMLNELITTANFNRERLQVQTIISARKAHPDFPLFRLLSAPGSGLQTASELADVPIAISKNTIIEYVTDRLLAAKGLDPATIVKKSVPVIPQRYQLLMQGQLKAALLPDPLAQSALQAGAVEIVSDSAHPTYSVSVLSFSAKSLKQNADAVRMFIKAWCQAAAAINAQPESFRALLLEKIRVPKNIRQTFQIPIYPVGQVPDADQWADVNDWMVAKGLLKAPLAYAESVTADYLP